MTVHPDNILVSCIMPTYNRRWFVPQAIKYFLRQDYEPKELIIVDDGTDAVGDLVPADERIRYIRLESKLTIGAKRNLACEQARGEIIAHWDDDDWMASHRINYQVEALVWSSAEFCGIRQMLFYDLTSHQLWLYEYPANQRRWLAGGALVYTRNFWKRSRFPEIQVGEDTRFVWDNQIGIVTVLPDYRFYVAMIHPENTSRKNCEGSYWSHSTIDLRSIMNGDIDFYQGDIGKTEIAGRSAMKLNLGCCNAPLPGFINVDIVGGPGVDQVVDLQRVWPWMDNSVEFVRAYDVIEHLPDKIFTMNELWRVLAPGGRAEIAVPTTDGTGAFQDPNHVSFWNRRSFLYYEMGNPYRERFAKNYGILARFRMVREHTDHTQDGPRLTILLEAIKT